MLTAVLSLLPPGARERVSAHGVSGMLWVSKPRNCIANWIAGPAHSLESGGCLTIWPTVAAFARRLRSPPTVRLRSCVSTANELGRPFAVSPFRMLSSTTWPGPWPRSHHDLSPWWNLIRRSAHRLHALDLPHLRARRGSVRGRLLHSALCHLPRRCIPHRLRERQRRILERELHQKALPRQGQCQRIPRLHCAGLTIDAGICVGAMRSSRSVQ